jgi:hypothetical protein
MTIKMDSAKLDLALIDMAGTTLYAQTITNV